VAKIIVFIILGMPHEPKSYYRNNFVSPKGFLRLKIPVLDTFIIKYEYVRSARS
jgi:hypothetical protein